MRVLVLKIDNGIPQEFHIVEAHDSASLKMAIEAAVIEIEGGEPEPYNSADIWRDEVEVDGRLDLTDDSEIYFKKIEDVNFK